MLRSIVRAAIRLRGVVVALACLVVGFGVYTLFRSTLDVFPEFAPPIAVIQTEASGLSAEQVEALVTQPIENAMSGTLGVESMRANSLQGMSMVTLTFRHDIDIYRARQLAAERLAGLGNVLPRGTQPPALLPLTSSTGVVMVIGLTSTARSAMELRTLADWTVRPQLLAVPGVADVIVFGGGIEQFQIQVDPHKLVRYGLSLADVVAAARRATGVRGAGFLETGNQRIPLHTEGQLATPERLADAPIAYRQGAGTRLGDVADVRIAPASAVGAAAIDGKAGVMLVIDSQYRADTLTVTDGLERTLAALRPILAGDQVVLHTDIFRPANFIDTAVGHLRDALLLGGVLIVVVLFLFLLDFRAAVISATAIPLSLLVAVIGLHYLGVSLNMMTLGGLAIALGEVVDDAIVDVENIHRRLRQNRLLEHPVPVARVVLRASLEVRSAVVYATFIVALAFLPVLTLSGVAGRLFAPLGIAYILAIVASLGVALTLTPALAFVLLAGRPSNAEEPRTIRRLKAGYARLLGRVERHGRLVMGLVVVLCVASLVMLPFFAGSFIPQLKEGHFIVHMSAAPGTSLAESIRVGNHVTAALLRIPGVHAVAQRAGRAAEVVDPTGVNTSEFEVELDSMSGKEQARVLAAIRSALATFPGLTTSANTFLTERIDETISGATAPVIVNVFGGDLDVLDSRAEAIAAVLRRIPGAVSAQVRSPPGTPQLTVRLRPDQLTRWGLAPLDVLETVEVAYEGADVGQVYEGGRAVDIRVVLDAAARDSVAAVGALPLRNPDGVTIPLRDVADIDQTAGRHQILHDGGQRVQSVWVYISGRSISEFVAEARQRVAREVTLPSGTYALFAGEGAARSVAQHDLVMYSLLAVLGIALLLYVALRSGRALLLVLANLPFALVGGVVIVFATGANLSLGSMVGFVTLFGITLRNSIMLISHYDHLVHSEGMTWGPETARRGASERLVPILMTALVTGLGLLPLALLSSEPGNEIEGPMAMVILGGLVTSTALNLLVLPMLAARFGRFERTAAAA